MESRVGCIYGVVALLLAAVCTIVTLAILGPTVGNVFSNVIDGLESSSILPLFDVL